MTQQLKTFAPLTEDWVQFPALAWQLIAICNSGFREPDAQLASSGTLYLTHMVHIFHIGKTYNTKSAGAVT